MKLVIFDLDQTLVDLIPIHNQVTLKLFRMNFGVDARLTDIDFAGRSLIENFNMLAALYKIPENVFREDIGLLEKYENLFEESVPEDGSQYVLAGARELLSGLSKANHFVVLYTGGSRRIGEAVLRITGLGEFLRLCYYGTEVKARADMVRMAVEQAGKLTAREFKGKNIVVIGDSVRDVECGKTFSALTIAVTTGFHSRTQLLEMGADFVVDDLKDWRKIIRIIDRS